MVNIIGNIIVGGLNLGSITPPVGELITADSTQYTVDTTILYTVDSTNTTA